MTWRCVPDQCVLEHCVSGIFHPKYVLSLERYVPERYVPDVMWGLYRGLRPGVSKWSMCRVRFAGTPRPLKKELMKQNENKKKQVVRSQRAKIRSNMRWNVIIDVWKYMLYFTKQFLQGVPSSTFCHFYHTKYINKIKLLFLWFSILQSDDITCFGRQEAAEKNTWNLASKWKVCGFEKRSKGSQIITDDIGSQFYFIFIFGHL